MKTILLILVSAFYFHAASAADSTEAIDQEINEAENVMIVRPTSPTIYRNSSEHNRIGKKLSAVVQLIGAGPSNAPSQGLAGSYFINRNSQFILEAMGNSYNSKFWGSDHDVKTNSLGVHFKHFTSNSFYLRTGVDYRAVDYKYNYNSNFLGSNYNSRSSFKGSSLAAAFAIGNQWQWENFTLGCDWIGISAPFASNITDEVLSGNYNEYDRGILEDDEKQFVKQANAQALRFYLGASF